ncbi:uncharacterized protein LOC127789775 [Diospyros lotus]|uniref:uncharacterized protein LOC127789775 n=1 Tax=Diospyros lotus TaxID=55363 RepID=UPI00224E81B5|nr:uncharacterized protein LOC127789775 [Diospyros lotus]
MDIRFRFGSFSTSNQSSWSNRRNQKALRTSCSRTGGPQQPPEENGGNDKNQGDKFSTDWDKAWSRFKKRGKKTIFSDFSPNKYVSWNPRRSDYPLSEEIDPIKRTERSNLMLWTSPSFTLGGAIIIVTFLLVYTILAPIK